jgi:hypothetical protein
MRPNFQTVEKTLKSLTVSLPDACARRGRSITKQLKAQRGIFNATGVRAIRIP